MSYSRTFAGRAARPRPVSGRPAVLRTATRIFAIAVIPRPGFASDSASHQLITRFAVTALTTNPLKTGFEHNVNVLEESLIEPDTVLRPTFGAAESRRHYVDLKYCGNDVQEPEPRAQLDEAAVRNREAKALRAGFDLDLRGSPGGQPQRLLTKRTAASLRRRNTS